MSSLLERIAARRCSMEDCTEDRTADAQLCPRHLASLWRNELDRHADGTYVARRRFAPRDETGRVAA